MKVFIAEKVTDFEFWNELFHSRAMYHLYMSLLNAAEVKKTFTIEATPSELMRLYTVPGAFTEISHVPF